MRITIKGWWINRDLTWAEAEAWHLRQAAKLAGSQFLIHREKQAYHLQEADKNRAWHLRMMAPMPAPVGLPKES